MKSIDEWDAPMKKWCAEMRDYLKYAEYSPRKRYTKEQIKEILDELEKEETDEPKELQP